MKWIRNISVIIVLIITVLIIINLKGNTNCIVKITSKGLLSETRGYGIVYKKTDKIYIVTNYHVINDSYKIFVNIGKKEVEAKLINKDKYEDIALITIDKKYNLEVAKTKKYIKNNENVYNLNKKGKIINKSNNIKVTLDDGNYIINAIKININLKQGSSGSPLFDKNNKVIGMITMKDENFGYAINFNKILKLANKLEHGNIKRPDLYADLSSTSNKKVLKKYKLKANHKGIIVLNSDENKSKLKKGDIIIKINNYKIKDITYFKYYLFNSNKKIKLTIYRNNKLKRLTLNS